MYPEVDSQYYLSTSGHLSFGHHVSQKMGLEAAHTIQRIVRAARTAHNLYKVGKAAYGYYSRMKRKRSKSVNKSALATVANPTTQGGGVRRIRGHKCRRKKQHVTEGSMKLLRNVVQPMTTLDIFVGPYLSQGNTNLITNGVLGANDNIPLGFPNSQTYESMTFLKVWFANSRTVCQRMITIASGQVNTSSYYGIQTGVKNTSGFGANENGVGGGNYSQTSYANDLAGNPILGYVPYTPYQFEAQITKHRLYNPSVSQMRVKAIYFYTAMDNLYNPLYLWAKDLASQTAGYFGNVSIPDGSILPGMDYAHGTNQPYINFQNIFSDATQGNNFHNFGDCANSGGTGAATDPIQMCGALCQNQGKMLVPGGPQFKKYYGIEKIQDITMQPGETLTLEHCNPAFKFTGLDATLGMVQGSIGNIPQYRPKWGRGIIFMVSGPLIYDGGQNFPVYPKSGYGLPTQTGEAVGQQNQSTAPPYLYHTYHINAKIRVSNMTQTNARVSLGTMPSGFKGICGTYNGTPPLEYAFPGVVQLKNGGNSAVVQNPQVLGSEHIGQ